MLNREVTDGVGADEEYFELLGCFIDFVSFDDFASSLLAYLALFESIVPFGSLGLLAKIRELPRSLLDEMSLHLTFKIFNFIIAMVKRIEITNFLVIFIYY